MLRNDCSTNQIATLNFFLIKRVEKMSGEPSDAKMFHQDKKVEEAKVPKNKNHPVCTPVHSPMTMRSATTSKGTLFDAHLVSCTLSFVLCYVFFYLFY